MSKEFIYKMNECKTEQTEIKKHGYQRYSFLLRYFQDITGTFNITAWSSHFLYETSSSPPCPYITGLVT